MRGAIYGVVPRERRSRRCHLHFVANNVLSATRLSVLRTHGRVGLFTRHARHVFNVIQSLLRAAGSGSFGGLFDHVRGCRGVDSGVRIRVTGCLGRMSSKHLDSRDGLRVHTVLHRIARVRDVKSDYCGLTHAVGHGRHDSVSFAPGRCSRVRRVFRLASSTLSRVVSLIRSRRRIMSIGGSFGVRGRVGGCHGRLGGRGILSIGGGRCSCRVKIRCVSVVKRYRGLNSCMMGIIRTDDGIGRGGS